MALIKSKKKSIKLLMCIHSYFLIFFVVNEEIIKTMPQNILYKYTRPKTNAPVANTSTGI